MTRDEFLALADSIAATTRDERIDWLFRNGSAGLEVEMHNGQVLLKSYTAGGYGYDDTNEHFYLSADQARQLRNWLNKHVTD